MVLMLVTGTAAAAASIASDAAAQRYASFLETLSSTESSDSFRTTATIVSERTK